MNSRARAILEFVVTIVLVGAVGACSKSPPPPPAAPVFGAPDDPAAIAANNRGVGLAGMFKFGEAMEVFEPLVAAHPGWIDVRVNLAIAILNRQNDGDEARAMATLEAALALAPDDIRARYCAGLLLLRDPDGFERAEQYLASVVEADPDDPYARYYHGSALEQLGRSDEALAQYERSAAIDPFLRSALYRVSQLSRRLGRDEQGAAFNEAWQQLADDPRARVVDYRYTRMGRKAEALAVGRREAAPVARPDGPTLSDAVALVDGAHGAHGEVVAWSTPHSITAADVDGDGRTDLYMPGGIAADAVVNALMIADDAGGFALDSDHPLAHVPDVRAALWGDYDNDGLVDVYLCRNGPNELWRQAERGRWANVTADTGTAGAALDTVDGAMFDADHDGDLDVFCVNADGANELFNNNLDGTFRPLAEAHALTGGPAAGRQVLVADLDRDGDADIMVINETPPHAVHVNERAWSYAAGGAEHAKLVATPIDAAVATDMDADGQVEIITRDREQGGRVRRWTRDAAGHWAVNAEAAVPDGDDAAGRLAVEDIDGDGGVEVLLDGATNLQAWSGDGAPEPIARLDGSPAVWIPLIDGRPDGASIVGVSPGGAPWIRRPGSGRHPFVLVAVSGGHDVGKSMRSNASGIGTRVVARVGSTWIARTAYRTTSGPGQSDQPLAIGLAGYEHLDFIALDWTDGIFQSEVHGVPPSAAAPPRKLVAGKLVEIAEEQRLSSSCPVLFAWDGERYAFVSDFLGVGGLGYMVAPGEYAPARPWENFMLPAGLLVPRDGAYEIKLAEPMQETCYLDAARLVAYDLPPGWSMTLDERMGIGAPAPTGTPVFYRRELEPARVINDRDEDVTESVRIADFTPAPVGALDTRFIGRLVAPNVLTLSFDKPIDAWARRPVLVADGWIEYPYSQTSFAAWQAGATYDAPTVEARGSDGAWHVILDAFGYPAGMSRQMSVPLGDLPAGTRELRISTNQEIYWDRLAIVAAEACDDVRRHELAMERAELRAPGFAKHTVHADQRHAYDYDERSPFWDARHHRGHYTQFGDVGALVGDADDALAIFGPGEEIDLRFGALPFPPATASPPGGVTRVFVLETLGWCKDRDLYTRDGETVGPLPARGAGASVRDGLHATYNTRFRVGSPAAGDSP